MTNGPEDRPVRPRLVTIESRPQRSRAPMQAPATLAILAVLFAVFLGMVAAGHGQFMEFSSAVDRAFGDKENVLIRQGEWWRMITPIFLHGGLVHLLVNSLSLWMFGAAMERIYGWRKYITLFVLAGIAGNIGSFLHTPAASLGASGAIFGLVGAGLAFPIRYRSIVREEARASMLRQLLPIAFINLAIGFSIQNVDNWCHLGGLAGGALAAMFIMPDALIPPEERRTGGASVGAILAILLCLAAAVMQARRFPQDAPAIAGADFNIMSPVGADGWWAIGVPPGWKHVNDGHALAWTGPDEMRLVVRDSTHDDTVRSWESAPPAPFVRSADVDGHPAWRYTSSGEGTEVEAIAAGERPKIVMAMVTYPRAKGATCKALALSILSSLELIPQPGER